MKGVQAMEGNNVVIINLDKPRELKLTHKVLKRFMAKHKLKMTSFDAAVEDYEKMTDLIYEMLRAEDPNLTPAECDNLLDTVSITEIVKKSGEAIAAAFNDGEEAKEEETKEKNPTEEP